MSEVYAGRDVPLWFKNLLQNAIKYTENGGVRVCCVLQENLGVATHGHQVRRCLYDGVHVFHAATFWAKSKHGFQSFHPDWAVC